VLAAGALSRRDWEQAAHHLENLRSRQPETAWAGIEIYVRCVLGQTERAAMLARDWVRANPVAARNEDQWQLLSEICGLRDPRAE
jgi:hypothetical protein